MFKNRKLFKDFVLSIKEGKYTTRDVDNALETLPVQVIRNIGKKIIYSDFDGYNGVDKSCQMIYFDGLNRWQKEHFIKQRLYKLCA